ncbi:hypothetical protein [Allofranklinella schreckenbergeri]|uniref:hypothetical protein n=1 Tax=Allofranklinella schreckenbergeri TaxID=1076744 RepID=UPI0011C42110|nr:hypothetical protein [Allofranklinella schreckenbergeri]
MTWQKVCRNYPTKMPFTGLSERHYPNLGPFVMTAFRQRQTQRKGLKITNQKENKSPRFGNSGNKSLFLLKG